MKCSVRTAQEILKERIYNPANKQRSFVLQHPYRTKITAVIPYRTNTHHNYDPLQSRKERRIIRANRTSHRGKSLINAAADPITQTRSALARDSRTAVQQRSLTLSCCSSLSITKPPRCSRTDIADLIVIAGKAIARLAQVKGPSVCPPVKEPLHIVSFLPRVISRGGDSKLYAPRARESA